MMIKHINSLAKYLHSKLLLTALGVATCFTLGNTITTTQANSQKTSMNTYSTKLAQGTNLHTTLSGHKLRSEQLTNLLVHQFQQQSDNDIGHVHLLSWWYPTTTKSNITYKFENGYIKAYGRKTNKGFNSEHKLFSIVSDSDDGACPSDSNQMTYFLTKHDLFIREMNMGGQPKKTVRSIKYHLHSMAKNTNGTDELVFYPDDFSRKYSRLHVIPKNQRHNYSIHFRVYRNSVNTHHSTTKSHSLLP